ncbi:hypothetical protein VNI00_011524 [Paramarasmius palmivorus]|uniref:Uncharacterized protein n=1 Tax=Paramarasmius palmivorus TaxID=297713 RepID=A0AAW0CDF6_9AGAR
MEFFNRVVETYPRSKDGSLLSIRKGGGNKAPKLELFLLRSFAEFPIGIQKLFPTHSLLTSRFRNNVSVVHSSLTRCLSEPEAGGRYSALLLCPGGDPAAEKDLSSVGTELLWAVEVVRLEGYMMCSDDMGVEMLHEACCLSWIHASLANHLGVVPVSGSTLYANADRAALQLK